MASDDQNKKYWTWVIVTVIVALMAVLAWWYFAMRTPTGKVSMADAYAAAFGGQIPAGSFDA